MPAVQLSGRSAVFVSGVEAQAFLQNIVTADVDALGRDEARACALLSPQGKVLFDFLVSRAADDAFRLDTRADVAADLARRLTLYKLRAKIEISVRDQLDVVVFWHEPSSFEAAADGQASSNFRDTRFPPPLGVFRHYGAIPAPGDPAQWDELRVAQGVAESGTDFALGDVFPHDVLLDQNGGVGFRKGCFVGQEVVSRMQHRGTARRRILVAGSVMPLPPPGAEVRAGGRAIGTLGTVAGAEALALVRIDRVADAQAAGVPVLAGEAALTLAVPSGMGFSLPEPGQPAAAD